MRTDMIRSPVTSIQLGVAIVLLVGVLVLAYGWFHPSKIGLYAGLFVTAAGVLVGVLDLVLHGPARPEHRRP